MIKNIIKLENIDPNIGKKLLAATLMTLSTANRLSPNKNRVLSEEARAAPQIPISGIKIILATILNTIIIPRLRVFIFCLLVALRKLDNEKFTNRNGIEAIKTCRGNTEKLNSDV